MTLGQRKICSGNLQSFHEGHVWGLPQSVTLVPRELNWLSWSQDGVNILCFLYSSCNSVFFVPVCQVLGWLFLSTRWRFRLFLFYSVLRYSCCVVLPSSGKWIFRPGHAICPITLRSLETRSCFGVSQIHSLCEEAYKISCFMYGTYITFYI